jgi:hypothetical protein
MEFARDFADLVNGLKYLPEREKLILLTLINTQRTALNGDKAKLERLIGQIVSPWPMRRHESRTPSFVRRIRASSRGGAIRKTPLVARSLNR